MILSELLTDLNSRPQTAHVLMMEVDGMNNMFMVESVMKEGDEKFVLLMGRSERKSTPLDAFLRSRVESLEGGKERWKSTGKHEATFDMSEDGKYQIRIDGTVVMKGIETAQEAKSFARGFVFGLEVGKSEKGLDAA